MEKDEGGDVDDGGDELLECRKEEGENTWDEDDKAWERVLDADRLRGEGDTALFDRDFIGFFASFKTS